MYFLFAYSALSIGSFSCSLSCLNLHESLFSSTSLKGKQANQEPGLRGATEVLISSKIILVLIYLQNLLEVYHVLVYCDLNRFYGYCAKVLALRITLLKQHYLFFIPFNPYQIYLVVQHSNKMLGRRGSGYIMQMVDATSSSQSLLNRHNPTVVVVLTFLGETFKLSCSCTMSSLFREVVNIILSTPDINSILEFSHLFSFVFYSSSF